MAEHFLNIMIYDGNYSGCKKCTALSKSLVGYKIPRSRLSALEQMKCTDEESPARDLGQNGVYFLFGETLQGTKFVYVGKVENRKKNAGLKSRLSEHLRDNDYWFEAVILTTGNGAVSATEASYLELRFYQEAKKANRYVLRNKSVPPCGTLTDSQKVELEKLVCDGKHFLSVLGYDLFVPVRGLTKVLTLDPDVFIGKTRRCNAMLIQDETGVVLLKGSQISKFEAKTCPQSAKQLRIQLMRHVGKDGKLKKDLPFSSPSAAAGFASGSTVSGLQFFKNNRGQTLADLDI